MSTPAGVVFLQVLHLHDAGVEPLLQPLFTKINNNF